MSLIRCLPIASTREALHEMGEVGVDPTGMRLMEGKTIHLNLKLEGITPRTSNLLKQEMLSLGGDAAVDRRGLDCSAELTDAILMGTHEAVRKAGLQIGTIPRIEALGHSFKETLKNLSKSTLQAPVQATDLHAWEKDSSHGRSECHPGLLLGWGPFL